MELKCCKMDSKAIKCSKHPIHLEYKCITCTPNDNVVEDSYITLNTEHEESE